MIYGIIIGSIIFIFLVVYFYMVDTRLDDTMSKEEYQKIKELFKKYGINQTGNGINQDYRYTNVYGYIKGIKIKVSKKDFKFQFRLEPDLSISEEFGISLVTCSTIMEFNNVFKNGIIEYFETQIKMKKMENKLNKINEDF